MIQGGIVSDVVASRPAQASVEYDARRSLVITEKEAEFHIEPTGDLEADRDRSASALDDELYPPPTEVERATLRKIPGSIPWVAWLLCICELAERASYYGAAQIFNNFMQFPLPEGITAPVECSRRLN